VASNRSRCVWRPSSASPPRTPTTSACEREIPPRPHP
jgi:hypothetical protein